MIVVMLCGAALGLSLLYAASGNHERRARRLLVLCGTILLGASGAMPVLSPAVSGGRNEPGGDFRPCGAECSPSDGDRDPPVQPIGEPVSLRGAGS